MRPRMPLSRRTRRIRIRLIVALVAVAWTLAEVLRVKHALVQETSTSTSTSTSTTEPGPLGRERIYITALHWNNEWILRTAWISALVELATAVGRENVFVSIQESGSWDDTKGALRFLDSQLALHDIPRRIVLDDTTHLDEISKPPAPQGWIQTPVGRKELRRVPYLANLRNIVMQPLYERRNAGFVYDKILFLNDVVFTANDVRRLLSTRQGDYAAACSLDFKHPPDFYDTFALRDSEGHEGLTQAWPYFRSRASRLALKYSKPVPVTSCWNGIVAMDPSPFYGDPPLTFRGIPDSLASSHLEGSECCLIHADNPLSSTRGVWLNPNVRVGYDPAAYAAVNPAESSWLSSFSIVAGLWKNRLLRWFTSPRFAENTAEKRLSRWEMQSSGNMEPGLFCLADEMQVLSDDGWAHR